ncbi:flagellar basal body L-ring protein FlgH [Pigmentiphaga sp.]|uniref:flagellar basal body L-ring protein FlgH n=1 Tax=Pigmentiphaga sp. TaxID=1977564 RepID=UPI00128B696D|nr:flagellar basal body L-ring protein FlgH [Pigmentiphaga sp.]MPS30382.1 flagellar basal body L-ring protein FlgH [Alcaligenaceae bacterium SAGV5]MPS50379.1 flagellar basal body L-ring protein FlgH [Alcaligenaceae bacterium SAGV3]MPT57485.1 flagellar basal body L-ring protein FlgH [Alcaligenaceae bacterium]
MTQAFRPRVRGARACAGMAILAGLAACATPKVDIDGPTTARPLDPVAYNANRRPTGGIFGAAPGYRPLFEDVRARNIGDTLVVRLEEHINSSQRNNTSAQRTASASAGIPSINKLPGSGLLRGLGVQGESENRFNARGETGASNILSGTITVTVVEVLSNGNMRVSGEKQIGTNRETERVRFSGVVNPTHIVGGNSVSSTQVADARIEYRGQGAIDEAQTVGWLSRFFYSFLPF